MSDIIAPENVKIKQVYGRIKDLTGRSVGDFGSKVLGLAEVNHNGSQWYVQCYCGDIFISSRANVKKCQGCFACGVKRTHKKQTINLSGQTFGSLQILKEITNKIYFAKCLNCYNFCTVNMRCKYGTETCGCSKYMDRDSVIGKKFNKLTILDIERRGRGYFAVCSCECGSGKITKPSLYAVKKGQVKSCGCYSKSEEVMKRKIKSKTKPYKLRVEQSNKIHNNLYSYPEDNELTYKDLKSKIKITCSLHGDFIKSFSKHIYSKQGCPKCKIEEYMTNNTFPGYSLQFFIDKPHLKNKYGFLYYVKINNGECFKIGITMRNVQDRFYGIEQQSNKKVTKVEAVFVLETTIYNAYLKEQQILKEFKLNRIHTGWSTEVFNRDISEEIRHYFEPSPSESE